MSESNDRRPFESACRDCSGRIVWAKSTRKDGSPCNMAFDPDASEGGRYALFHPGGDRTRLVARYVTKEDGWPEGSVPRTPHYLTCTARASRKPGGPGAGARDPE